MVDTSLRKFVKFNEEAIVWTMKEGEWREEQRKSFDKIYTGYNAKKSFRPQQGLVTVVSTWLIFRRSPWPIFKKTKCTQITRFRREKEKRVKSFIAKWSQAGSHSFHYYYNAGEDCTCLQRLVWPVRWSKIGWGHIAGLERTSLAYVTYVVGS